MSSCPDQTVCSAQPTRPPKSLSTIPGRWAPFFPCQRWVTEVLSRLCTPGGPGSLTPGIKPQGALGPYPVKEKVGALVSRTRDPQALWPLHPLLTLQRPSSSEDPSGPWKAGKGVGALFEECPVHLDPSWSHHMPGRAARAYTHTHTHDRQASEVSSLPVVAVCPPPT